MKATWFDFRDNVGGGVLDLIQRVHGCGRGDALRWLAELNGITLDDRPPSPAERREYARQRAEASEVAVWRGQLVDALKRERERCEGALTPAKVAFMLKKNANTVRRLIQKLYQDGLINRTTNGKYIPIE